MSDTLLSVVPIIVLLATWLGMALCLAFWIWMLVHAFKKGSILWLVIMALLPISSAIYYLDARPKLSKQRSGVVRALILVEIVLLAFVLLAIVSPGLTS